MGYLGEIKDGDMQKKMGYLGEQKMGKCKRKWDIGGTLQKYNKLGYLTETY